MPTPTDAQVLRRTAEIVSDVFIGLLTTVDDHGRPHSRYMAAAINDNQIDHLFSLTAKETRKIEQIGDNPAVCWTFATPQFHEVVTLKGLARTMATADLAMSVWNQLIDHAAPYAPDALRDEKHYAYEAVVTQVESVEYLHPEAGLVVPRVVAVG